MTLPNEAPVADDGDGDLVIEISGSDVADGSYAATLTAIKQLTITVTDPDTGRPEERQLLRWIFALPDGREAEGLTSHATGPRSKMAAWLGAMLGGDAVVPGARLTRADLIGREVMVVVGRDKNGYAKVTNVVPEPRGMRSVA